MKYLLFCLALGFSIASFARETPATITELLFEPVDESRSRTVPVKVYLPKMDSPQPVIVFSHGLGGSRNNSVYLGKYWAEAGYVAVFVQHQGSDESVWKDAPARDRMKVLKAAASLQSSLDRQEDIPFVLDTLEKWNAEKDHALFGKLNLEKIGMTGHSFGAVTTQAMMGQKFFRDRDVREPRFDAFMPMSPSDGRAVKGATAFGDIQSPVLCMTGTKDESMVDRSATPESRRIPYQSLPEGEAYELVFEEGDHMAFSDRTLTGKAQRQPRIHPAIQKISTMFWDAYLRDDESAKAWLKGKDVIADSGLTEKDIWNWK